MALLSTLALTPPKAALGTKTGLLFGLAGKKSGLHRRPTPVGMRHLFPRIRTTRVLQSVRQELQCHPDGDRLARSEVRALPEVWTLRSAQVERLKAAGQAFRIVERNPLTLDPRVRLEVSSFGPHA